MHLAPGAPIMKSYDLVSWEIVGYVYDRLGVGDVSSLRNGKNGYGNGQWASSLRYRDGTFYVVFNTNDLGGSYLFRTDDVEHGAWERTALGRGFHDPSLFFDEADGGTPYIFYGSGATSAVRLNDDLTAIEADFPNIFRAADYAGEPFVGGLFEGAQVHYIDGEYYVAIITWPSGQNRQEVLFRSPHLLGRYETADGSNPYEARSALNSDGFAQAGWSRCPTARAATSGGACSSATPTLSAASPRSSPRRGRTAGPRSATTASSASATRSPSRSCWTRRRSAGSG